MSAAPCSLPPCCRFHYDAAAAAAVIDALFARYYLRHADGARAYAALLIRFTRHTMLPLMIADSHARFDFRHTIRLFSQAPPAFFHAAIAANTIVTALWRHARCLALPARFRFDAAAMLLHYLIA